MSTEPTPSTAPFADWSWWLAQLASLLTWLAVGLPMVLERLQGPVEGSFWLWLFCYLAFGVFFLSIETLENERFHASKLPLLCGTLLTFGVMVFGDSYWLGGVLLIIVASYAPHVLRFSQAALWVLAQTALTGVYFALTGSIVSALVQTALYLSFQVFALFVTQAALSEAAARERLAQVNAELRATQALLSESSRTAERLRIARELHDLIGHHLTALSLNLEVATHLTEGKAREHVGTAQEISKTLLGDVRGVVSSMREPLKLDIARALTLLGEGIPKPTIHIEVEDGLELDDPERAQVIIRCAQEAITNAVKHAGADHLWLRLAAGERGVILQICDDGRGAVSLLSGNGLNGMRERLEALGGSLELNPNPGRGFALSAVLPR